MGNIKSIAINKKLIQHQRYLQYDNVEYFDQLSQVLNKSSKFIFSTIQDCNYLITCMFGSCSYFNFNITDYLPYIKEHYLNFDGYFKQVYQLNNNDVGKFCRSNSSNKVWSGQIIKDKDLINLIKDRLQDDDLLYLSDNKQIDNNDEYRCWIYDNQLIEVCNYTNLSPISDQLYKQLEDYINTINDLFCYQNYSDYIVVDVCKHNNQFKVVEYNCFSTSGFYNSNIQKIADVIIN